MNITVFTKTAKDAFLIENAINKFQISLYISHSEYEFVTAIELSDTFPDLFIVDYYFYNHDFMNIGQTLLRKKKYIPIIFYNDPFIINESDYCNNWKLYNNAIYGMIIDMEPFNQILESIADIVPHIIHPINSDCLLFNIQSKYKIQLTSIPVLRILLKNRNHFLTVKEIGLLLQKENIEMKLATLYSHVSRLKKAFNTTTDEAVTIERYNEKYKLHVKEELLA